MTNKNIETLGRLEGRLQYVIGELQELQNQNNDGCVNCKYEYKDEYEMPCLICKRNKVDYWQIFEEDE